ncbi:MAG: hypothetical protein R2715_10305 [Ilumatobacteraceae bacterium]
MIRISLVLRSASSCRCSLAWASQSAARRSASSARNSASTFSVTSSSFQLQQFEDPKPKTLVLRLELAGN